MPTRKAAETHSCPDPRSIDPQAVTAADRRYRDRLLTVVHRIVGNRADAEDVVQRVFMALPRSDYRGDASLGTYLHRAAVNGAVNVLRARRRREAAERALGARLLVGGSPSAAGPEAQVLEAEVLSQVARALLQVRPRHRRVLLLRIVWGLGNAEIAAREGLPLATVGTWLRRGRAELRRKLGPLLRDLREEGS